MTANDCLFCKIVRGEIPADVVLDEPDALAFRDIHPQAPTHVLVVPKVHVSGISAATDEHALVLGKVLLAAKRVAEKLALSGGYRLVVNDGRGAGQSVFHVHVHVLSGRPLGWPPG